MPNPLQPGGAATAAAFLPTVTAKAPLGAPPPPREKRHFDPRDEAATAAQIAAVQAADRAPAPAPAAQDNGCHAVQGYYAVRGLDVPLLYCACFWDLCLQALHRRILCLLLGYHSCALAWTGTEYPAVLLLQAAVCLCSKRREFSMQHFTRMRGFLEPLDPQYPVLMPCRATL